MKNDRCSSPKCCQNAVKMLPKCCYNAAKILPKCCQNAAKMDPHTYCTFLPHVAKNFARKFATHVLNHAVELGDKELFSHPKIVP